MPVTGQQVEHVVEEADAGAARRPPPLPSSRQARRARSVSPRRARDLRCSVLMVIGILPHSRASIDSACTSKPSARAIGAPAAASFARRARRSAPRPSGGGNAGRERRGEARGAGCRQHVVGARRRSRRRPSRCRRPRTGSPRVRTRGASSLDLRADQLQVLRRERVGQRERLARPRGLRRPRSSHRPTLGRSRRAPRSSAASASQSSPPGDAATTRLARAVLGLGEHVERGQPDLGRRTPRRGRTSRSLGPAKPSMPTMADSWCLASWT